MTAETVPQPVAPRRVRRIQASRGLVRIDFEELWRYRELLYLLVWRDVKARYKQTFLGAFWAIFRPFVSMILFTVIFGHLAKIKAGNDVPYPLFVFTGMLLWGYFSSTITGGASSLSSNSAILSKVYFPRVFAPLAAVTAPLVDFVLSFVVLAGLFVWFDHMPPWQIVLLPCFLLLALLTGLGISFWLASVTVKYRDVQFALPFVVQIWMYVSPVIYPITFVPDRYRWLLDLNPGTGILEGGRWAVLGGSPPAGWAVVGSACAATLLLVTGAVFFRRAERTFVDTI